jgi:uncharacterized cofD-like protein
MSDIFNSSGTKVVVIGGGTGSFMILSELKNHTKQIAALVSMADDGGSTGVLRDELGVLPPGDIRQCLVALSNLPKIRDLFDYRFEEGSLSGHSFGNLLLTALEKTSINYNEAIKTASEMLKISGTVIPSTLDNVRLKMEWPEDSIILRGERVIDQNYFKHDPKRASLSLVPNAKANPRAVQAVIEADIVIIAPGDLYTSLGPLLIISGIQDALVKSKAKKVYVANLVTKDGQTRGFTVSNHAGEVERFVGSPFLDYVLYNNKEPSAKLSDIYRKEGAYFTDIDRDNLERASYKAISGNFIGDLAQKKQADGILSVKRSLIRHDARALVKVILSLV